MGFQLSRLVASGAFVERQRSNAKRLHQLLFWHLSQRFGDET